jgi:4-hydroxybenzoate polyprenyltransferase
MIQQERDAIELRFQAVEMRSERIERSHAVLWLAFCALAGLVVAAFIVGAVELRAVYHLVEAQQWRSR